MALLTVFFSHNRKLTVLGILDHRKASIEEMESTSAPSAISIGTTRQVGFKAPSCWKAFRFSQQMVGRTARCNSCGTEFLIGLSSEAWDAACRETHAGEAESKPAEQPKGAQLVDDAPPSTWSDRGPLPQELRPSGRHAFPESGCEILLSLPSSDSPE